MQTMLMLDNESYARFIEMSILITFLMTCSLFMCAMAYARGRLDAMRNLRGINTKKENG